MRALKLPALLLVLLVLMTCGAMAAGGENGGPEAPLSVEPSDWETDELSDGTLSITGYLGSEAVVSIPEALYGKTVTEIGDYAFSYNDVLTQVGIPDTVTRIGSRAFYEVETLTSVQFGEGLTEIGSKAFYHCTALTAALPEGLVTLGSFAFEGCTALASAYIPSTLESGYYAFAYCGSLTGVTFGAGIARIPAYLFSGAGLTQVVIPDTVTEIGTDAFHSCTGLTAAELPESLLYIGSGAFENCTALASVCINASLEEGWGVFEGCSSLTDVTFGEDAARVPDGLFYNCTGLTAVVIPDTVEEIGGYAFDGCTALASLLLSENLAVIGDYAFDDCAALTAAELPDGLTHIGGCAFRASGLLSISVPDSVTEYGWTFLENCTSLKTAKLSASAPELPSYLFLGCTALESVVITAAAAEIPYDAFSGCASLRELTLPDTITEIQSCAFLGCASLTDLDFLPWSIRTIGSSAFENCTGLLSAVLPDDVYFVDDNAFKGCTALTSFTANAALTALGNSCFENCTNLKTVSLTTGITAIPSYAFAGCRSIESLVIPRGVIEIRDHAFYQDTKLLDFTIPETVLAVGDNAFSYPGRTTVRGVAGSYIQTYANWKAFIDITSQATGIALATGSGLTIPLSESLCPRFVLTPEGSTDSVVSLVSADEGVVRASDGLSLYGQGIGTTTVTALTYGGLELTFPVTVDYPEGIEITRLPDKTAYLVGEKKDLTGLEVSFVFESGARQRLFGYEVSGFTTATPGRKTVTVSCWNYSATFEIEVEEGSAEPLAITAELTDYVGPLGSTASFTVEATGTGLSYQWWVKKPSATKFSKSSVTGPVYEVELTEARNGNQVYCVVTDAFGNSVRTNAVTMTIEENGT